MATQLKGYMKYNGSVVEVAGGSSTDLTDYYTKSEVDTALESAGKVKTVNSIEPDENGNIEIEVGSGGSESYTAGEYISITDNKISVDYVGSTETLLYGKESSYVTDQVHQATLDSITTSEEYYSQYLTSTDNISFTVLKDFDAFVMAIAIQDALSSVGKSTYCCVYKNDVAIVSAHASNIVGDMATNSVSVHLSIGDVLYCKNPSTDGYPVLGMEISLIMDKLARNSDVMSKQDALVSGTNIKTLNKQSLLGEGNITIDERFTGLDTSVVVDTTTIGSIIAFAGTTAPKNYLLCDGSTYSRTDYAALFNVIGTTYGEGDGITTFNVPNIAGSLSDSTNNTVTMIYCIRYAVGVVIDTTISDFITDYGTSEDGTQWYRQWNSGWLEQGGINTSVLPVGTYTLTFLKSFADTSYNIEFMLYYGSSADGVASITCCRSTQSTSSIVFTLKSTGNGYNGDYTWYACGQGANIPNQSLSSVDNVKAYLELQQNGGVADGEFDSENYTQLQYLEKPMTTTPYITLESGDVDTTRGLKMIYSMAWSGTIDNYTAGFSTNNSKRFYFWGIYKGQCHYGWGATSSSSCQPQFDIQSNIDIYHEAELNYLQSGRCSFDGFNHEITNNNTIYTNTDFYLFRSDELSTAFQIRIKEAWYSVGTKLKYHLLPALRKSDSVAGMYDTVTGTFFTNTGSGEFTYAE